MEANSKVVLVTGTGRVNGIGFACCQIFASSGYQVIGTVRDANSAQKVKKQLGTVDFHILDVTDEESINRLKKYIYETYKRLDILVNNAAIIGQKNIPPLETDVEQIIQVMNVNALGSLRCIKAFVPLMKQNNFGRIINISSGIGKVMYMSAQSPLPYALSKGVLNGITKAIADELKQENKNISVFALNPGFTRTDMHLDTPEDTPSKLGMNWMTPAMVAEEIFLLSNQLDAPSGTLWEGKQQIPW